MTASKRITSADNPRVKALLRLREQRERRKSGLFIVEGSRLIERAADAGLKLIQLFTMPTGEVWAGPGSHAAEHYELTPQLMKKVSYQENPPGVLAVFEQRRATLDDLGSSRASPGSGLILVAVGAAKPGNLGAMARSADAAGAEALLVADGVVDIYNPNVVHASTGAVFSLPIVSDSSDHILAYLRERRMRLYAAAPAAKGSCYDADFTGPTAIIIGPEDAGLDDRWLGAAIPISIPMAGRSVDSLNASVAAAVLLFEAARQRRLKHRPPNPQPPL